MEDVLPEVGVLDGEVVDGEVVDGLLAATPVDAVPLDEDLVEGLVDGLRWGCSVCCSSWCWKLPYLTMPGRRGARLHLWRHSRRGMAAARRTQGRVSFFLTRGQGYAALQRLGRSCPRMRLEVSPAATSDR